MFVKNTIKL